MYKRQVTAIATGTSIKIDAETVLYVPQDDRPVSLQYTVDTAREAGMTVLTPPQHLSLIHIYRIVYKSKRR